MTLSRPSARGPAAFAFGWVSHYARRFQIAPLLRLGALGRRVWRLGTAERLVLAGLGGLTAMAALAALPFWPEAFAQAARSTAHLGLFVLAWSVALAAAAAQRGPLALTLVGSWLAFYQILICGAWVRTPIAVLPLAWLGWVFFLSTLRSASRIAGAAWWLIGAAGLAYVGAGPSGLRHVLGWTPLHAQLLLFGALVAAGAIASRWMRADPGTAGFAYPLRGALITMALAVGASAIKEWDSTVEWTQMMTADAGAIVVLFWMWMGGRFAEQALKLTEWTVRVTARGVPQRFVPRAVPGIIAVVCAIEWIAAQDAEHIVSGSRTLAGIVLLAHAWVGLAALAVVAWLAVRRRFSPPRALSILTWWIIAWLVLKGLMAGGQAVLASRAASAAAAGFALVVLAVGLAYELSGLERAWIAATEERVRVQVGLVALAIACAVVVSTTPGGDWETTRALMVLAGMVHLGVPQALYPAWRQSEHGAALDRGRRVLFFAGGYAAALAVLAFDPRKTLALLASAPVLVVALILLRRARPDVGRAGGALAGALFGGGLIAGWMMPYPPTLPFLPVPALIHVLRDWGALGRPPLTLSHLELVLAAWIIGGGLGWTVFRLTRAAQTSR